MYTLLPPALACVAYHGRLPFAAPLACDVIDAAGVLHRAEYVPDSMLDGAAQYAIDGQAYELRRDGTLAIAERRAA